MLSRLLILGIAVATALTAGTSGAHANEQEVVDRWTTELREAQKHCDEGRYRAAKRELLAGIDAQINTIDRYLRYINESSPEERARDQRLAIQLIADRQKLTSKRAMYAHEQYVPCDEDEPVPVEYVRICDAYGAGFFYIPGTQTCLSFGGDGVERRAIRATNSADASGDVCDELGISGPIISSDGNCLQIGGSVNYEFHWGGDEDPNDQLSEQLTGAPGFWAELNPSATFGGKATRGAFATEVGGSLVVPGYNFDTGFTGAGLGGKVSATLPLGGFPVTLSGGFEVNSASAASSAGDVAFPEGFGIPGVGPVPGAFINSPTDMLQFDFTAQRRKISAFFEGSFPVSEGQLMLLDMPASYRLSGLAGVRGGSFSQHEMTTATTSSPAFGVSAAGTSTYETDFTGGFGGLYAGLSLDKNIPFGDDGLSIQEMFSFAVGYDMYRLDISDHVVANGPGALALNNTNSFSITGGVPIVDVKATVGVGGANWMAGITAGVTVGKSALIDYKRLDDGGNPHLGLLPEAAFSIGASFTGRY